MRAIGVAAAMALLVCADAEGQETASYVDPKGQFTFEYPVDWPLDKLEQVTPTARQMALGGADAECWVTVLDRAEWEAAKPWDIRRTFADRMEEPDFLKMVAASRVGSGAGALTSLSVETVNGWPVQLGEVATADTPVIAAWHVRPGFELRIACRSYDGQDHSKTFRAIALSAGSPKDAEWNAEADAWNAKKAAAQAENAKTEAAAAEAEKPGKKKR